MGPLGWAPMAAGAAAPVFCPLTRHPKSPPKLQCSTDLPLAGWLPERKGPAQAGVPSRCIPDTGHCGGAALCAGTPGQQMRLPCDSPFEWACFVALGSASWLTVNSVFAELPLFASTAPEGWGLGALLGLAIQLANVFALAYLAIRACWLPRVSAKARGVATAWRGSDPLLPVAGAVPGSEDGAGLELSRRDSLQRGTGQHDGEGAATLSAASGTVTNVAVLFVLVVGMAATVLLGATWSATVAVGGAEHSVALLALTFLAGGVDCVSTVTFWPFAGLFAPEMTTAMAVGEGMSGVLPGLLALVQAAQSGADRKPALSPLAFFLAMAGVLALSLAAFMVLCRRTPEPAAIGADAAAVVSSGNGSGCAVAVDHRDQHTTPGRDGAASSPKGLLAAEPGSASAGLAVVSRPSDVSDEAAGAAGGAVPSVLARCGGLGRSAAPHARLLCLLFALSFAQNGALTALLPYACAPLDPREAPSANATGTLLRSSDPGVTYRWANTAGLLADPVGALLTLAPAFVAPSATVTGSLAAVWAGASVTLVGAAVAGPGAPWGGSTGAAVFVALAYTLARLAMGLQRAQLFLLARHGGFAPGGCSATARPGTVAVARSVTLLASVAVQVGACVGSVLLAVLVGSTDWFHQTENAQL